MNEELLALSQKFWDAMEHPSTCFLGFLGVSKISIILNAILST